jgi:predicted enzyme related to lactoylglutathione lyase
MTAIASLAMVNLDCDNPPALAKFYHEILGWEVTHSQDEYAMVSDGKTSIGFGRVEGYEPPRWPDPATPKRYHLDMYVDDLDKAEERCLDLGAAKPDFQPGGDRWRVLTDPSGQPFCLCAKPQG